MSPPSTTTRATGAASQHESTLYLPKDLFFIETIELPAELADEELDDFAELNLEAIAPFPIEQLNWGYWREADAGRICLYAAHRDRLKQQGYDALEGYTWVFPDFIDSQALTAASGNEQARWAADVRSPAFKQAEQRARRTELRLSQATRWTLWLVALLLALEAALLATQTWQGRLQSKIDSQSQEVARIEDQYSLLNKLENVAQNELRPIAILEALNAARPAGIYFSSTTFDAENRVTVDGVSNTINELNQYTNSLTDSKQFELNGPPKSITRSGKTTFSVSLRYHPTDNDAPHSAEEVPAR